MDRRIAEEIEVSHAGQGGKTITERGHFTGSAKKKNGVVDEAGGVVGCGGQICKSGERGRGDTD